VHCYLTQMILIIVTAAFLKWRKKYSCD